MESRVTTCSIHSPSMPEGQLERKHCNRDCQKATDLKVYTCSDTNLGKALFHCVMLCDKENWDQWLFLW